MAAVYREETRGDRTLDWLSDENLRFGVSRLGAELVSIQRRNSAGDWIGFLHRDNDLTRPASGWANHATVMGYFLHRLKGERSVYRGREIRGGTHSFLRAKSWRIAKVDLSTSSITYQITPEDFSETEYPLRVSLELTYAIVESAVHAEFRFINDEPELPAHVGFGLHPGFAAKSFESFQFQMPAGIYRRHFSPGNFLSGETKEIEFGGGPMPFAREELPGSFILELVQTESRKFLFRDQASSREVAIDLGDAPYLTLWSDGGAFLCVEPCWGLTDHHDQRAFENKAGIQIVPAGGELVAYCAIAPRLL
jgi:galactose mutarotase-like enzyme